MMKNRFLSRIFHISVCVLQLAYCVVQFLEKDPSLTEDVSIPLVDIAELLLP